MKPLPAGVRDRDRAIDNRFDKAIRKAEQDGIPFGELDDNREGVLTGYLAGLRAGRKLTH